MGARRASLPFEDRREAPEGLTSHYPPQPVDWGPHGSSNVQATFSAGHQPLALDSAGGRWLPGRGRPREERERDRGCLHMDNAVGLCAGRSAGEGCLFWEWLILVQIYILNL